MKLHQFFQWRPAQSVRWRALYETHAKTRRMPTRQYGRHLRSLSGLSYSFACRGARRVIFMSGRLRHIALTVEQTGNRSYAWVLIESAGGCVFVLKKGVRGHGSYLPALQEGYEELALLSACGLHERGLEHGGHDRAAAPVIELVESHDAQ